ncbi:hypothetical protein NC653_037926 [Populus alba x Populus x berolinensis]|uniref:Uncharacterized protein n=1 Tax=Populus alba x Populus x berolinensis TaxID=444605 RepID=A0AAD6LFD8_9ROSI|nr:hypothetical protein NC653_037926 [Populus alba x Populus x berolinensis]
MAGEGRRLQRRLLWSPFGSSLAPAAERESSGLMVVQRNG